MSGPTPDPEKTPRRRANPTTHPQPSAPVQPPTRRRRSSPKQVTAPPLDDADAWAAEIAATLPPMTPAEAAHIGHLAATLDARRAAQADAA